MAMEQRLPILFRCFILVSVSSLIEAIPSNPRRLVIKLIHRDSAHSPYYNESQSFTIRTMEIRRALSTSSYQPEIYRSNGLFLVNFSIGQPPIAQLATMDTGSSLLWLPCRLCGRCSEEYRPAYDSKKSSTYIPLSCNSDYCIFPPRSNRSCTSFDPCIYRQDYVRFRNSTGNLAKEQLTFRTSDEGFAVVQDAIFGCAVQYNNKNQIGVFGLGFESISLIARLGKLSHCIGSVLDPDYLHNQLILGDDVWIEEYLSTPLEVINGLYHVVLEGISVGSKRLQIDPTVFRWNGELNSGVIIDSGTVATWLVKEGYEAVLEEIQSLLDTRLTQIDRPESNFVCYGGIINQDLAEFPALTFHFEGGVEMVLDIFSLFFEVDSNVFCVAVGPSHSKPETLGRQSIIGLLAQQNHNLAFDVHGKQLTLQRIACELLED